MDYALGITLWTARENSPQHDSGATAGDVPVEIPVVRLVALALYRAAANES